MIRFSIYSLLLIFSCSCASDYKMLKPVDDSQACKQFYNGPVMNQWYLTTIDVVGKHLSGLLFIKKMDSGSDRVVFTSEAGLTMIDIEFFSDGTAKPHYLIEAMNKPAVVNTLLKDFDLLLGKYFGGERDVFLNDSSESFSAYKRRKEMAYIVYDSTCSEINRLELSGKKKRKVTIQGYPGLNQKQDSTIIQHHTFEMKIKLVPFEYRD